MANVNPVFDDNEAAITSPTNTFELVHIEDEEKFKELVITRHRPTCVPCLSTEVRAMTDVVKFCENATLVLNNHHVKMEPVVKDLIKAMLMSYFNNENKSEYFTNEVFRSLLISNTDSEGDYSQFAKTLQGFEHYEDGTMTIDPSWLIAMASLDWIDERMVGITTTDHPIHMGPSHFCVQMLAIVLTPIKEKHTKSDVETSKNIATILSRPEFRNEIHSENTTETSFRQHFRNTTRSIQLLNAINGDSSAHVEESHTGLHGDLGFGKGIAKDFQRRLRYYCSDYADAFRDRGTLQKTITTVFVLFFANLLPSIAFGMVNESNTKGKINVTSGLIAQFLGGVIFALIGGQQLTVMLTTSPLCIMIFVFYKTSKDLDLDFFQFYALIGIFNTIYLFIYAFTGVSRIMKYSRRSTEETFELFVSVTFIADAVKACVKSFTNYYHGAKCDGAYHKGLEICLKEQSLLFLLLLMGTMALGLWLNGLTRTPYLNTMSRKIISEFALPVAVLFMAFVGSFIFKDIKLHNYKATHWSNITINVINTHGIELKGVAVAAAMAFPLSILIFMEQNIASSILNSPLNQLKKGTAYHWDIMIVGLINLLLSVFGLPWIHGALPHSPMHLTSLAMIEDLVDEGNHIEPKVVKVVETRVPVIIANILVGSCIFLMPYPLQYIPAPVLNGLFLYMALQCLHCNQLVERLLLFITEQSAYPPNHYLKRVPQKKVHAFTLIQLIQFGLLCALGFSPEKYVKMAFPFLLIFQLPIRHKVLPKIIGNKYLKALDKSI